MRQILNISVPKEMGDEIKKTAKANNFSVSEYIRAAVRAYGYERGWRRIQKGEREFAEGKYVVANSVRDLE